jgi:hypothetical protein
MLLILGFVPTTTIFDVKVEYIPDSLLPAKEEDKSLHASNMFDGGVDIVDWFKRNLVMAQEWTLEHPDDILPDSSNDFIDYCRTFEDLGYKVWNIENKQHATSYLKVSSKSNPLDFLTIGGRADYLITKKEITIAEYLNKILCVIEIQSKRDIEKCELQMQVYLLILMNSKHLFAVVGFLVLNDGTCRAFKASRDEGGGCLFEMNDLFHVCHIAQVMHSILVDLNLV